MMYFYMTGPTSGATVCLDVELMMDLFWGDAGIVIEETTSGSFWKPNTEHECWCDLVMDRWRVGTPLIPA